MKRINLYKASSFKYTPFDDFVAGDLEYLNNQGIFIVNNINEADVIISQNLKYLKKHFWRAILGKKFMIWTLEPRFDTSFERKKKSLFGLVNVHFMNIYTRNVFVTNLSFHAGLINKTLKPLANYAFREKKTIALMSYYLGVKAPKLIRDGENIDLIALRSKIAIEGAKKDVLDVYGKGWPDNLSKEDSRDGDWVTRKKALMEPYEFNLCFENTATYNYMTEKIWDSIENYCLPIYYGKNTNAYEIFPERSFIDYSKFTSPEDLFDYIKKMTVEEYVDRMNKCIMVYNSISKKGISFVMEERKKALEEIVAHIQFNVLS